MELFIQYFPHSNFSTDNFEISSKHFFATFSSDNLYDYYKYFNKFITYRKFEMNIKLWILKNPSHWVSVYLIQIIYLSLTDFSTF